MKARKYRVIAEMVVEIPEDLDAGQFFIPEDLDNPYEPANIFLDGFAGLVDEYNGTSRGHFELVPVEDVTYVLIKKADIEKHLLT